MGRRVLGRVTNAGIDHRLTGVTVADRDAIPELIAAARGAGVETYKRRRGAVRAHRIR